MFGFAIFDFVNNWPVWAQIISYIVGLGVGVYCLVQFCNFFVDSAGAIAKKLKISPLIIGLTIVAMGTSLPELAVSTSDSISCLIAADGSHANVAIANVIGSNICNLLLVLGFSIVFTPIIVKKNVQKREFPILLGISALLVLFVCLFGLNSAASLSDIAITRWEGIILVVGIGGYITYLVLSAKRHPEEIDEVEEINDMPWWKAIVLVIAGALGIALGGALVEFGAKGLAMEGATAMNLDHDLAEQLVGFTIVAVGTSLPELVTSTIAAKKGQNELALGNVIGSNIFNTLFVLGIAGTVNPLIGDGNVIIDVAVMMVVTVLVFLFALKDKLKRSHGIVLLSLYVLYLTYLVLRTILHWSIA